MNTYGAAYKAGIEAGALTAMVGHIMQPAWTRRLNPGIKDEDIMPGTLSREMMQGLLRGELGFNGLICTDATTMAGYTLAMSRRRAVPESIAAVPICSCLPATWKKTMALCCRASRMASSPPNAWMKL